MTVAYIKKKKNWIKTTHDGYLVVTPNILWTLKAQIMFTLAIKRFLINVLSSLSFYLTLVGMELINLNADSSHLYELIHIKPLIYSLANSSVTSVCAFDT